VRRVDQASKSKLAHIIHVNHRDEVEAPLTDWLREAYMLCEVAPSNAIDKSQPKRSKKETAAQAGSETAKFRRQP
jgi:hypothetical protein